MNYRREIDGLRAVAVLPVIFFHAGFKAFEGGFVGVDVFFVISGYLITSIILSDMNSQKFSIVTFYERRARRILPALFFVMLCCLPFAWIWLVPGHLKEFSKSVKYVSFFSSNLFFLKQSGYFSSVSELKPLLHTWSLAVEEQYYILFPLFLMALWRLRKRWIFGALIAVGAASLLYAQWGAYNKPSATFYLLPTRSWELAIGALIAFYFIYKREHTEFIKSRKKTSEAFGLIGLFLILYSVFAFDKSTPFPGFYALIPTIGTGLIIMFSTSETAVGRFLSIKPMVGIGLISYSTYLWHQPLFAFARHSGLNEPATSTLLVLSVSSVLLAYISWRFVESPFRDKNVISRKGIFSFAVVGSLVFAITGIAGSRNEGFPSRYTLDQNIVNSFERQEARQKCDQHLPNYPEGIEFCEFGSEFDSATKVAVFGDSHSEVLLPVFDSIGKENNYSIVHMGFAGCLPLLGVDVARGYLDPGGCVELASREYEYVKNNNIKKVFLVARWSLYTDGDYDKDMRHFFLITDSNNGYDRELSRENFKTSMHKTIDEYAKLGAEVIVVMQVPQQDKDPKSVYYKLSKNIVNNDEVRKLSVSYEKHLKIQRYSRNIIEGLDNAKVINFDELLCDDEYCLLGEKDYSFYTDDDHLSSFGSELLSVPLTDVLLSN